jgi:hypothetical protein
MRKVILRMVLEGQILLLWIGYVIQVNVQWGAIVNRV